MLEAKLEQASTLKRVIECIKDLITDCNLECTDQGISLQALETSHIVLVSMLLEKDGFSSYRNDRNLTLGINLNSLATVLKCAGNDDTVTLRASDDSMLSITFEDTKRDRISEFNLKLMNIDQDYLTIPDATYETTVTMPSVELQKICRDFTSFSDSLRIESKKEGVKFSCEGESGDGSVHLKAHNDLDDPDQSVTIEVDEPLSPLFNLKYFNNITKASSLSTTVTFKLSKNMPSLFEYTMPSGQFKYFFAPKIDEEGEDSK